MTADASTQPPDEKKSTSDEQVIAYLKTLKIVVGSDGNISPAEHAALRKGMDRLKVSDEMREELEAFDPTSATVEEILASVPGLGEQRARMLVYDCIHLSSADGFYSSEERATVTQMASQLGVDVGTRRSIEALVELERGVRRLHRALFPSR